MLEPIYGLFFGIPGCLVMGVCNLIMDVFTDSLTVTSASGFLVNVLGPLCFHVYWKYISGTDFDLRSMKNILKYLLIVLFTAVMTVLILVPAVAYYYQNVNYVKFGGTVLLNGILFPILLGMPVIILMQEELGFVPCERKPWRSKKIGEE